MKRVSAATSLRTTRSLSSPATGTNCESTAGLRSQREMEALSHLLFFCRCEVVFDVEGFADLLRSLAFDHVGDRLARHVQQSLDVQVVRSLQQSHVRFRKNTATAKRGTNAKTVCIMSC